MRLLYVIILVLSAGVACAKDPPPKGIAIVQAQEGVWLCRKESPEDALGCAREQCAEQAPGQKCWATAWCFPAGWSALMKVELADFHFAETVCGAPSEAALKQELRARCLGEADATRCSLFNVIDPDGNERTVEGETYPGAAAPKEAPASGEQTKEALPKEPAAKEPLAKEAPAKGASGGERSGQANDQNGP